MMNNNNQSVRNKDHYPNMISEIFEAIHLMFEDNSEVEADCYLFLENLHASDLSILKLKANLELTKMHRCSLCGGLLQIANYKDIYSELNNYVTTTYQSVYCPNCDRD